MGGVPGTGQGRVVQAGSRWGPGGPGRSGGAGVQAIGWLVTMRSEGHMTVVRML